MERWIAAFDAGVEATISGMARSRANENRTIWTRRAASSASVVESKGLRRAPSAMSQVFKNSVPHKNDKGRIRRAVIVPVVSASLAFAIASSAQAADLSPTSIPDPIPDTLTYKGVTLYGVVDVAYAYQTAGAPLGTYWGLNYNVFADLPAAQKPISSITQNALSQSVVGIKIDEPLGYGWKAIGQLETGFSPLSGELADACASIIQNNGKLASQQTVWGDGPRCGQALNGNAYGGISNSTYGTLTVGRQLALASVISSYDSMESSFAFSLFGWTGSVASGQGIPEAARWDNSVKYRYDYGPVHAQVMYAQGSEDTTIHGNAFAGNIGATWNGLSIDAVYTVTRDGIASSGFGVGACGVAGTPSCNTLKATALNADGWIIAGKYVHNLNPGSKLTFFAGYENVQFSDPSNALQAGDTTIGGYVLGSVNNTAYLYGDKVRQVEWVGAKYETGPWSFATAYYHLSQGFYKVSATSTPCSSNIASNCAGESHTASALVDYALTKHFDIYSGVVWSSISGGFANGYNVTTMTTALTGVRLKF